MPVHESFRIEILSHGQSLSDVQLVKRIDRFTHAIGRLLLPLRLGKRLQFCTETDGKLLWLVATIEASNQIGLYSEELDDLVDPEHAFEVESSKAYLANAIRYLQELLGLGSLTAAALERFVRKHDQANDDGTAIHFLAAGLREHRKIHVQSGDDSTLMLDCTNLPRHHTSESFVPILFSVQSVGRNEAQIRLSKSSKRLVDATKTGVRLFYPVGADGKKIRATLFSGMEDQRNLRCNTRCTRTLLGTFHSAYVATITDFNYCANSA